LGVVVEGIVDTPAEKMKRFVNQHGVFMENLFGRIDNFEASSSGFVTLQDRKPRVIQPS
jgi:hypothetical protein